MNEIDNALSILQLFKQTSPFVLIVYTVLPPFQILILLDRLHIN
jgi:hypothetical protein